MHVTLARHITQTQCAKYRILTSTSQVSTFYLSKGYIHIRAYQIHLCCYFYFLQVSLCSEIAVTSRVLSCWRRLERSGADEPRPLGAARLVAVGLASAAAATSTLVAGLLLVTGLLLATGVVTSAVTSTSTVTLTTVVVTLASISLSISISITSSRSLRCARSRVNRSRNQRYQKLLAQTHQPMRKKRNAPEIAAAPCSAAPAPAFWFAMMAAGRSFLFCRICASIPSSVCAVSTPSGDVSILYIHAWADVL
jgi:hypothetical protein